MKANMPRSYNSLSPFEKKRIEENVDAQYNKDVMIILDIYLKMSCLVLHDAFGFGEKRLTMYLGNYRRLFNKHARLVKRGQQLEQLDKDMQRIFRKSGYPDDFFKSIFSDWSAVTK